VGGATVLRQQLINLPHPGLSKSDSPLGGTAWVGLDESHITLHWYTLEDSVRFALDAFTCGDHADPTAIVDHVLDNLLGCVGRVFHIGRFDGAGESSSGYRLGSKGEHALQPSKTGAVP
ncbi:hypothetical protein LCGC14_2564090, partial [marine sediment metagenome]